MVGKQRERSLERRRIFMEATYFYLDVEVRPGLVAVG